MRTRYSAWNLLAAARRGHRDWAPAWRDAEPKPRYDIVIVGGGGHGLAAAYYLARNHGLSDVAVLEAGWLALAHAFDQSPGSIAFELQGRRLDELLHRLLDASAVPAAAGRGTRTRLADVAVSCCASQRIAPGSSPTARTTLARWIAYAVRGIG